ncbi:MAG: hypothetical protein ACFBSE_04915 [Prochloraceae cyanobacterium]
MIVQLPLLGQETTSLTTSSPLGDETNLNQYTANNNTQTLNFESGINDFSTSDPINPIKPQPDLTATETDLLTGNENGNLLVSNDPILEGTARSAASFIDSIATSSVNKKYDWNAARSIADDIGIKHFRNLTKDRNGPGTGVDRLIGNNYTFTVSVGVNIQKLDPSPQAITQLLADIKNKHFDYRSRISALEGPNEYDYVDPNLDSNWSETLRAFVKEFYQQMRADPWFDGIPYVGPSFARDYSMQELGDISAYIDAGNLHLYTNPPTQSDRFNIKYSGYVSGNLPLYTTEMGNNTKTVTEEIEQARLYPRMYLVNFDRGVIRSHAHVLIDSDSNSSNGQKRYGIVRSDFTYKPAAVAIKNTIALLRDDRNQNNLTDFRFLNFSIDTQATDLENTLIYHAGKDKYYLALWRGIFNDTAIDADPFPVTIDFAKNLANVTAYKPNDGNFSTIVPIDRNRVTVNINDEVTFLVYKKMRRQLRFLPLN